MDQHTSAGKPSFPVHHQLPEPAQTHVHCISDAIQPTHPLSSPSLPAFNLSHHQGSFPISQFFPSGGQSIGVSASVSVLPMNSQDWFSLGLIGWVSLATTIMNIYSLCVMPNFFPAQFLLFFFVNNSSFLFQNQVSLFLLVFLFSVANSITSFLWI